MDARKGNARESERRRKQRELRELRRLKNCSQDDTIRLHKILRCKKRGLCDFSRTVLFFASCRPGHNKRKRDHRKKED